MSSWSLSRWVAQGRAGLTARESKTLASESPEQRELRRLRQQLAYVERQRDILKRALGILSAETPLPALR